MSAHVYFGLFQMVLSEHQVLLPVETDGGEYQVCGSLDGTGSERGNHSQGRESYLYLKNNFMKCCSIQCGDELSG